jgi:hypothetical protein
VSHDRSTSFMTSPSTSQIAFGLHYQPSSVKLPAFGQGDVLDKLWRARVDYIRFQWVDYTNVARYRVIPRTVFHELMSAPRPGIGVTKAALGLVGVSLAPGFSGTGEYLYTPDLSSTRLCGYAPRHASIMGWFEEKLPSPGNEGRNDSLKVPLCPRGLLRDIVKYVWA